MGFVHTSVRINSSVTRVIRDFLIEKEIVKWLGTPICIENKISGKYKFETTYNDVNFVSDSIILEKEFERLIKLDFNVPSDYTIEGKSIVEVNFMLCNEDTEYCTEIHIIHRGVKSEFFKGFWDEKLNNLREYYNGDWVIEDRDLVLSILEGSR